MERSLRYLIPVLVLLTIVFTAIAMNGCPGQLRWLEVRNTSKAFVRVMIGNRVYPDDLLPNTTTKLSEEVFRGGIFECWIVDARGAKKDVVLRDRELDNADDGKTLHISYSGS